jgi:hypothetical protein
VVDKRLLGEKKSESDWRKNILSAIETHRLSTFYII